MVRNQILATILVCLLFSLNASGATTVIGTVSDAAGGLLANGTIQFKLSQEGTVTDPLLLLQNPTITCTITTGVITVCSVRGNDEISPAGTVYEVQIFDADGITLLPARNYSITGATWDIGTQTPNPSSVQTGIHGASLHSGDVIPPANQEFGAFYSDFGEIAVPANPGANVRRLFVSSATGQVSVRTNAGTTVSLEAGAGGGATHQIDAVALTSQDPINFLDTPEFDWTNPAAGNLSLAIKAASIDLTTKVTGTLPVGNGGTGTATAFTLGSVVFAGASGVYTQDNANLFWNDTSNRLGIDTALPDSALHIKANIPGTVGSHPAGQLIIQNPANDLTANVVITGYESDASGNPDQQLWYLGNSSSSNQDIILLNRRSANLHLGTNGVARVTVSGGGNVGIGTQAPATSALLELSSTTGALLPTRLTTTQRDALTAVDGMILYNSTDAQTQSRVAGAWVDLGGTGGSSHDILSATHSDTTAAAVTRGGLMVGKLATPKWQLLTVGAANTVLGSDGTDLAWGVTTIAQGGTGQTTANPAMNALSPVTTEGDLVFRNATVNARLARGSDGQCLKSNTTTVVWGSCAGGSSTWIGLSDTPGSFTTLAFYVTNSGASALVVSSLTEDADSINSSKGLEAPSFTGTGNPYIQLPNWTTPTVGGASTGRIVYESATQRLRASLNTAAYSDIALASDNLSLFSATTIAQLATLLSDENFTPGSETSAEGVLDLPDLQGTLGIGSGGTGQTTANAAFNALSPVTTEGDLIYRNATVNARLARGTNGQCLTSNATTIIWGSCAAGSGDEITVNAASTPDAVDLDDADPAAPSEQINIKWQLNTATTPDSVSAYVPILAVADGVGVVASDSGFEPAGASSDLLALLQGCADGEILKWDNTATDWECAADASGGSLTIELSILDSDAVPDASGNVWAEPFNIAATNDNWLRMVWVFNDTGAARDCLHGGFLVPQDYQTGGTASFNPVWSSNVLTNDVEWDLDYRGVGGNDTESFDQATAVESLNANDVAPSAAWERLEIALGITEANLAAGDDVEFMLCRDKSDAGDTLVGDAYLFRLIFSYTN